MITHRRLPFVALLLLLGIADLSAQPQTPIANPVMFDMNPAVNSNGEGEWSWLGPFTSLGNELILTATNGTGTALYAIDATVPFPTPRWIRDFQGAPSGSYSGPHAWSPRNVNGTVYLAGALNATTGLELFKSNGTTAGTVFIRDLQTSTTKYTHSWPNHFRPLGNGKVIFTAAWGFWMEKRNWYHELPGLFVTDGTSTGTVSLCTNKAIITEWGFNGGHGAALTVHNGIAYGFMKDYVKGTPPLSKYGYELWKSNGTAAGTTMVKDIWPGPESGCVKALWNFAGGGLASAASRLVPVGNDLYFTANDGSSGYELWKTNGTTAGTVRVMDIFPGAESSRPAWLTVMNDILYFAGRTADDGDKLLRYVPATNTVDIVADIHPGTGPNDSAHVSWITAVDGTLYFSAFHPNYGQELWMSDGVPTAQGGRTQLVADINQTVTMDDLPQGSYPNISWPGADVMEAQTPEEHCFFSHNGWIYFPADDGVHGIELWRSNGLVTQLLTDINQDPTFNGGSSDIPYTMTVVNNKLFFHGYDKPHGWEPCMIDLATLPKSVAGHEAVPTALTLSQNHPNPFNPTTMIDFAVPEDAQVRLTMHDALGREVARLVDAFRPAGNYSTMFDGASLPSGSYLCRLEVAGRVVTRIMTLSK